MGMYLASTEMNEGKSRYPVVALSGRYKRPVQT